MTQAEVARALGRHQPFVANIENGDRRIDLVELIDLALVIDFEIDDVLKELQRFPSDVITRAG